MRIIIKIRKTYSSQSIAELLMVLIVIGIVVASVMSSMKLKLTDKNLDINSMVCVKSELAANFTSTACSSSITSCRYNQNNACSTLKYYADHYNDLSVQYAAHKILGAVCDQGGRTGCQYFISSCQKNSNDCDNATSTYDLQNYLNMPTTNTTSGRYVVEDMLKPYYGLGYPNLTNIVDNTCCTTNLINTACDINKVTICPLQFRFSVNNSVTDAWKPAVDSQGNIYLIGGTSTAFNGGDAVFLKTNSSGGNSYAKTIGTPLQENGNSIAIDSNDNTYVTVLSNGTGGNGETTLIKMNGTGGTSIWQEKFYLTSFSGYDRVRSMLVDSSGNINLVGYTNTNGTAVNHGNQIFYIQADSTGTFLKQKIINVTYGGSASNYGFGLAVDKTGNVYISALTYPPGGAIDYGFIKMNSSGNMTAPYGYQVLLTGPLDGVGDDSIAVDSKGNLYSTGGAGSSDLILIKVNGSGNITAPYGFAERLDSLGNEYGYGLDVDSNDNIFVSGYLGGNPLVIRMNSSGNMTPPYGWQRVLTSSSYGGTGWRLIADNKGSIYIAGYTTGGSPSQCALLLRMNEIQSYSDTNPFTNITNPYSITAYPYYMFSPDQSFSTTNPFYTNTDYPVTISKPGFAFQ